MSGAKLAVVIGYGSIGRRHARALASLGASLVIVNRGEAMRKRATEEHPSARVVARLEELEPEGFPWESSVAVIATWGPSHAELFHALADRGVRRVLCEKPMAASVADADGMARRGAREGIWLGLNHTLRYARLAATLRDLADEHGLGAPVSVAVEGGAACLSTNGVHWIDFVTELFEADPVSVISTATAESINPRAKHLAMYGGTAAWRFLSDRDAVLSFSNRSSVRPRARVSFRDALAEFSFVPTDSDEYLSGTLRHRDREMVARFPAVTRTGPLTESLFDGMLPGTLCFNAGLETAARELLYSSSPTCSSMAGVISISSVIGALLAAREGRTVGLPVDPGGAAGRERWPIS